MAKQKKIEEKAPQPKEIYVEYLVSEGEKQPLSGEEWQTHSQKSMEQVVATLQEVARQVVEGMEALPDEHRPAEIVLSFGIRTDVDKGAVLAQDIDKTTFGARLVWYHKDKPVASLRLTPGLIPPAPNNDD
jgi:hypothetical protein